MKVKGPDQKWNAEFLKFLESLSDGIVIVNSEGCIVLVNAQAEKMFGYSRKELVGKKVEILLPESFRDRHVRDRAAYHSTDLSARPMGRGRDLSARRKDGSIFPVEISLSPMTMNRGAVVIGLISDITERKKVEEEHRDIIRDLTLSAAAAVAQERLTFLSEAGRLLASSLDYETTLTNVARLAVPFLGDFCVVNLLQEDRSFLSLRVHRDSSKEDLLREMGRRYPAYPNNSYPISKVLKTGRSELISEIPEGFLQAAARDAEHLRMLYELRPASVMVVPLSVRGLVLGTISFVSSESRRRYGPADLNMAEDMANRCAFALDNAQQYRTAQREIARRKQVEEALLQRTKEAEEANRLKSRFVSIVSHDLRTPLNAILGFNALLQDAKRNRDVIKRNQMHDRIRQNALDQLDLINNLLDLHKIETGRMELEAVEVSLSQIVREISAHVSPLVEEKGLAFSVVEEFVLPPTRSDPRKLRQIFTNLIANAIKFTEKGSITARLYHDFEEKEIAVEIRDTGIGMNKKELSRIFEPFYRIASPDTQAHTGMGLGLSIVKNYVDLLGGTIRVKSEVDVGSTFTVSLPYSLPGRYQRLVGDQSGKNSNDNAIDSGSRTISCREDVIQS
jgi:PAS domain S-box-containing protein